MSTVSICEELLKAGERYFRFVCHEKEEPTYNLNVIEQLWKETGKYVFFPQAFKSGGQLTKGLFLGIAGLVNGKEPGEVELILKVLPTELLILLIVKRYFKELDRIIRDKCHEKESRHDIIRVYDSEMVKVLRSVKNKYRHSKLPLYLIFDNNWEPSEQTKEEWTSEWGGKAKNFYTANSKFMAEQGRNPLHELVENCSEENLREIVKLFNDEDFIGTPFLVIDVILGFENMNGIDYVKKLRDSSNENRRSRFLPIIMVSKHFSDHTITDALVMARADWFMPKGQLGETEKKSEKINNAEENMGNDEEKKANGINKIEEMHMVALFLNSLRYREYFKYILLFIKFLLIYLYVSDNNRTFNLGCFKKINNFIDWVEGTKKDDFPRHKPYFITQIATRVNDKINKIIRPLEDAVAMEKRFPEKIFKDYLNDLHDVLEKEIEAYKEDIGLKIIDYQKEKEPVDIEWQIPKNGGTIRMGAVLELLEIDQEFKECEKKLKQLKREIKGEQYLYLLWEKMISKSMHENKKWV